jgi:hypothetical protein
MPLKEQYQASGAFDFTMWPLFGGYQGAAHHAFATWYEHLTLRCARCDHVHERHVLFSPSQSEPFDWFDRELVPPK